MPQPFDAANKHLVHAHPADFLTLADLPLGTSQDVVDTDLSIVSAASDKIIRVNGPDPFAFHCEFQSGPRETLDLGMGIYNLLGRRHLGLPVRSVLFALRPVALTNARPGIFDIQYPQFRLQFDYKVIRVWELSPERLLRGGVGTLPLAPIAAVTEPQLPAVIQKIGQRLAAEAPREMADLWTVTEILMGLRWPGAMIHQLMRGARQMKDSVIYQEFLEEGIEKGREEGRRAEAHSILLDVATAKFGPPDAATARAIEAIEDRQRLTQMTRRVATGTAANWQQLLAQS
jgi:hypothetical protein